MLTTSAATAVSSSPYVGIQNTRKTVPARLWDEAKDLTNKRPVLTTGIVTSASSFLASLFAGISNRSIIQYLPLTFLPVFGSFIYEMCFPLKPEVENVETVVENVPAPKLHIEEERERKVA